MWYDNKMYDRNITISNTILPRLRSGIDLKRGEIMLTSIDHNIVMTLIDENLFVNFALY